MAEQVKSMVVTFSDLTPEAQKQVENFLGESVKPETPVGEFKLLPKAPIVQEVHIA